MNIYHDDEMVARYTDTLIASGVKLFSFYRTDNDDEIHIKKQLEHMNLPYGAKLLDCGCGIGEFARLAKAFRPDIEFTLLNISKAQLDRCPDDMEKVQADMHKIPFDDGYFDAVLVDYVIGHSRIVEFLNEVSRVLRHGGIFYLHDIFKRDKNAAIEFHKQFNFTAYDTNHVLMCADMAGFVLAYAEEDSVIAEMPNEIKELHGDMLGKMLPMSMRFLKSGKNIAASISKHQKIAVQFSGGKDSTATLYLLRPWWNKIVVYWTNPGDSIPETKAVIDKIKKLIPNFVEIKTDVRKWREENGYPSDIVSFRNHELGNFLGFGNKRLSNRFDCCWNNLMYPMYQKMVEDGITLIVRGTKDEDMPKQPVQSGETYSGIEILYPIQDWTNKEVFAFLKQEDAPISDAYAYGMPTGQECFGCTAWWDDGKSKFLTDKYPEQYEKYKTFLIEVKQQIIEDLSLLEQEIGHG